MVEKVQTGGTKTFDYRKSSQSGLDERERREIEKAYQKADERKRREKRNKIILIIIAILITLAVIFSIITFK